MPSSENTSEASSRSSGERQRADAPARTKGYLPRLAPDYYRGRAFVHWTLTTEKRGTGWLTPAFYHAWQLTLLHTCARYSLACPAYVLMPDHIHLLWLGLNETDTEKSDQRLAIEFLRKQLRPHLAPADWQKQAHDHVLVEAERSHGAFQTVAHYLFENPARANLISLWPDYPYVGCCVPGYPEFNVRSDDYRERFWRCYNYLVEKPNP